ncbi:ParB N-terminal domain-containing protein [Sorangium sp. So ce375]|uniref:ParB N-terminal domain-containing protein n=1 Tax=Sorangium sp. So ce375 TaxID=3133306 RepID=UPI003F5B6211
MKNRIVNVPAVKDPIKPSPGFEKKGLSDFKLDIMGLCGFGCAYCSSNEGNYLRIRRKEFLDLTEEQIGERALPSKDPSLTFVWPNILTNLKSQLDRKGDGWGAGHTLVFSMLTDAFSPVPLKDGTTEAALRMVLERTRFRIRVLTKNAAVGSPKWIRFFERYPGRFTVGLSIGSLDDAWARRIEVGTSPPSARLRVLARLQGAGVPTFGMACPIFPDVLEVGALDELIDRVRPDLVEDFWADPFNNRTNWQVVRNGYAPGTAGYQWFTDVFEHRNIDRWSEYATDLYVRLLARAHDGGWTNKLRYLLYEENIVERDAPGFAGLEGVMLQSNPAADGRSANPFIARLQQAAGAASSQPGAADLLERTRCHLPLVSAHLAEGARIDPALQGRHQAGGQHVPAAPKGAARVGIAEVGDSFGGSASDNGSSANGATREKAATATPSSRRRIMVRKRRKPPVMGGRKNAAKSRPRVSRQKREEVREIPLTNIEVPKRRARQLRDVTALQESIAQTGLIEPIVVRRLPGSRIVLVSGAHRLEAHRQLGRETILARIVVVSDLEAELIELDENLARSELTVLERGEHLLRRKEIYEELHPETRHGGAPGKSGGGKKAKDATVASFAEDASTRTGLSIRTIQDDVKIARLPAAARQAIRGTPIEDQKRVLLQITRLEPDKQTAVAEALASGRCRTVRQAGIELGGQRKRLSRPQRGDIRARVRKNAQHLHDVRKCWERLVEGLDPARAAEGLAIGEEIAALEQKMVAFVVSTETTTAPAIQNDNITGAITNEQHSPARRQDGPHADIAAAVEAAIDLQRTLLDDEVLEIPGLGIEELCEGEALVEPLADMAKVMARLSRPEHGRRRAAPRRPVTVPNFVKELRPILPENSALAREHGDVLRAFEVFDVTGKYLRKIEPVLERAYDGRATTRASDPSSAAICDAIDRFVQHGGSAIVAGQYTFLHHLEERGVPSAMFRDAGAAFVREMAEGTRTMFASLGEKLKRWPNPAQSAPAACSS